MKHVLEGGFFKTYENLTQCDENAQGKLCVYTR